MKTNFLPHIINTAHDLARKVVMANADTHEEAKHQLGTDTGSRSGPSGMDSLGHHAWYLIGHITAYEAMHDRVAVYGSGI